LINKEAVGENGQDIKTSQPTLSLRKPKKLSEKDVKKMIDDYNFFDQRLSQRSSGFKNDYVQKTVNDKIVIEDKSTGLTWQQCGFAASTFGDAQDNISKLNGENSESEWRLPTLEEAMSLMEQKKTNDLHINSIFNPKAKQIWTSDYEGSHAWIVSFTKGHCVKEPKTYRNTGVLAVRSGKSLTAK